ncbi:MAG TPA: xylose isomerase [Thermoanaerobaculia bacterium]|nr:xylose isomerase [Thermoanaerobaculia bacterium]
MSDYFPEVPDAIPFEGPGTDRPLAFRWYDRSRKVGGRTMERHLRFAVCYWHTFRGGGADPFGLDPVHRRPWDRGATPLAAAEHTLDAAFELFTKLGVRHWCFHDRDLAPEGASVGESARWLEHMVGRAARAQRATGVRLLWGTANLFSHPRYTHGAATNPDPLVTAHAAAQVRAAIDATVALGGTGYVFWGGREGYSSLRNTDMKRERAQLAAFLHAAVDYATRTGFEGRFFIEPKPREPSLHQYDFDCAHTLNSLREFDLFDHFDLNVEANHATLASHSFEHELRTAADAGKLGSLDVNRGVEGVGWDTDNFPLDLRDAVLALAVVRRQGGLRHGGLNFDAKVRRGSFDTIDLFHAHVGAMDVFARALLIVERMRVDGFLDSFLDERYAAWRRGLGRKLLRGEATLEQLETWAAASGEPELVSGREEMLENRLNRYLDDPGGPLG